MKLGVVRWSSALCAFVVDMYEICGSGEKPLTLSDVQRLKYNIVGNIYDSPEILKIKDKN